MLKTMIRSATAILMMGLALSAWAGCHHSNVGQAADIRVDQAQINATTESKTEAIMGIHNLSEKPLTIVAVYSPVAEMSTFHQWVSNDKGQKSMMQIPSLEIPAEGSLVLQADGTHVMLMGLKSTLPLKQVVPITLIMADGSTVSVQAEVVKF